MDVSHKATKKANTLAKQLFLGTCEFFLKSNASWIQFMGDHFEDEGRWLERRLTWIRDSLSIQVPDSRNLGEMSEVILLDSTTLVRTTLLLTRKGYSTPCRLLLH